MNTPTLVVLAAGLGSRYGGLKQIDGVGRDNETLLDYSSYDAIHSGFGKILYIIRKDFEQDFRERFFNRIARNCDADYVYQSQTSLLDATQISLSTKRTKPWGTIHAILCAKKVVKEPFAVINADDYYGRNSFAILGKHLTDAKSNSTDHAMVGYVLENTMSKSGSVSRAICTVENGYLVSMCENTQIRFEGSKVITHMENTDRELSGKEWVSMNFFGFMPSAFDDFDLFFRNFLEKNITSEKAEAYLPEGASKIVTDGKGSIKFYSSDEKWFGMTYPDDREIVKKEISVKIDQGYYPEVLWGKS